MGGDGPVRQRRPRRFRPQDHRARAGGRWGGLTPERVRVGDKGRALPPLVGAPGGRSWWALLACLAASAVATYLLLGRTQAGDSRWAMFALTAIAAPAVLAAALAAAIVLSTLLSENLEERAAPAGRPESTARTERTDAGATTEGSDPGTPPEHTAPATGSPSASASASAGASSPAFASASAAP